MNIQQLHQQFLQSGGASTDTRKIVPGSIFFALRGPNHDANALAGQAIEKGAILAVIDAREFATSDKMLLVDDVLETLQALAAFHRRQLSIPVLALTGSNGKTTTKELINAVLSQKFRTQATQPAQEVEPILVATGQVQHEQVRRNTRLHSLHCSPPAGSAFQLPGV